MKTNKMYPASIALGIALAAYAVALPAFADDGGVGGIGTEGSVGVGAQAQMQVHIEGSTSTVQIRTQSEENSRGENANTGSASSSYGAQVSGEREGGQEGAAMSGAHAQVGEGEGSGGGEQEQEFNRQNIGAIQGDANPAHVQTTANLQNFAAGVLQHNPKVTSLGLSTTSVSTEVNTPAKLLGFIPASIPAHVQVAHNGTVQVTFPWYAFLFATQQQGIQQAVSSSTGGTVSTGTGTGASAGLSAQQQARVIDKILGALQGLFGASASASASSTAQ